MRNFVIKYIDKIILSFLAIFGFANCDTPMEYGTPYADFEISGTVTDSITSNHVKQIRVIRQDRNYPNYGDTVYTDANGKYKFTFEDLPMDPPQYTIKTEDTDGTANGGDFQTRNVLVTINESDWVDDGDNNWYYGKAKKTQNIRLQPKK